MNKKICCIFNYAPHYRFPIYKLMDKELDCDFYFGHTVNSPIKKLDYNRLTNYKKEVRNHWIFNTTFIWQFKVWPLVFKRYKYYILTGEPSILSNWLIMILGRLLGKKVLVWSHGMKGDPKKKADWFELYFYKLTSKILLYGNHSRNVMLRRGFSKDKLVCIYNSLDHDKQIKIRSNLTYTDIYKNHFKNDSPTLLFIGRIQESKKLDLLIEALTILNNEGVECNLVFVGRDLGDNNVKEMVLNKNLSDKVLFYGPCYDEDKLGELIYNATVCVSPGSVGLTAIHSLAYGTPVISHDNFYEQAPEHEVITKGKTGDFYKYGDIDHLCETLKKWLRIDGKLREDIRKNCYDIIDRKWNPKFQLKILDEVTKN